MSPATPAQPSDTTPSDRHPLMELHGILRVTVGAFEYGGYRYSNLDDAVAQAKRSSR